MPTRTRENAGRHADAEPMRHFSQSLPMLLLRAREAVMRHFRGSLRVFDLTEQQWRVLRALASADEIDVSDLARITFLLAPSLSRIMRDLERRQLIARRAKESDLRSSLISITPQGRSLMAEVAPKSEHIYAEIANRFGSEKLKRLQSMLGELEDVMTIRE